MTTMHCPIKLSEIISAVMNGAFKPLSDEDKLGYEGIEGAGFSWIPENCDEEVIVIMDRSADYVVFEVYLMAGERQGCWKLDDNSFQEI